MNAENNNSFNKQNNQNNQQLDAIVNLQEPHQQQDRSVEEHQQHSNELFNKEQLQQERESVTFHTAPVPLPCPPFAQIQLKHDVSDNASRKTEGAANLSPNNARYSSSSINNARGR